MFDKCVKCPRIGESCIPNLMLLSFPDLIAWWGKRQKHLEWTNQMLADKSGVALSTISRIKAGDYTDCYWSTMQHILIVLFGGTTDEFSCTEQVERELKEKEQLIRQAEDLSAVYEENARLKDTLHKMDEQHRCDIRAVRAEYQDQIAFLRDEAKAWRELRTGQK